MSDQNFSNHSQMVPGYHYVTATGLFLTVIGAGVNLYGSLESDGLYSAALIFVLSILTMFTAFYARVFALKAQDRAIRVEENLRNYVRHGALLDARLTTRQVIALRFASDEEYDELAKKAIENNMSVKEIKQAVTHWKADTYRV